MKHSELGRKIQTLSTTNNLRRLCPPPSDLFSSQPQFIIICHEQFNIFFKKHFGVNPVCSLKRKMQPSARHHSKDKSSRIKFKGEPHLQNVTSNDYDEAGLRARFYDGSYQIINTSSSEDLTEVLDTNFCYHRDCCFAYNIRVIILLLNLKPDAQLLLLKTFRRHI